MSRPGSKARPLEASTLEKSHSNNLFAAIRNLFRTNILKAVFLIYCNFKLNLLLLVLDPDLFDQRPNCFVLGGRKIFKGVGNAVPIRVNHWWKRPAKWGQGWSWPQACQQNNNKEHFLHVQNTRTRLCGQAPDMRFSARCLQFLSAFMLYSRESRGIKRKPRSGTLRHICRSTPHHLGKCLPKEAFVY